MHAATHMFLKLYKTTYFSNIWHAETIKKLLNVDILVSLHMLMYAIGPSALSQASFPCQSWTLIQSLANSDMSHMLNTMV